MSDYYERLEEENQQLRDRLQQLEATNAITQAGQTDAAAMLSPERQEERHAILAQMEAAPNRSVEEKEAIDRLNALYTPPEPEWQPRELTPEERVQFHADLEAARNSLAAREVLQKWGQTADTTYQPTN